jgi:hypothetical protein
MRATMQPAKEWFMRTNNAQHRAQPQVGDLPSRRAEAAAPAAHLHGPVEVTERER